MTIYSRNRYLNIPLPKAKSRGTLAEFQNPKARHFPYVSIVSPIPSYTLGIIIRILFLSNQSRERINRKVTGRSLQPYRSYLKARIIDFMNQLL